MRSAGIPRHELLSLQEGCGEILCEAQGIIVKADGLAAGKGVTVATVEEALVRLKLSFKVSLQKPVNLCWLKSV